MRRTFILLLCCISLSASAEEICDFAPLKVGHTWEYVHKIDKESVYYGTFSKDSFNVTCRIVDIVESEKSTFYIFENGKKGLSRKLRNSVIDTAFVDTVFIDTLIEDEFGYIDAKIWSVLNNCIPVYNYHCIGDSDPRIGFYSHNYPDSLKQFMSGSPRIYVQNIGLVKCWQHGSRSGLVDEMSFDLITTTEKGHTNNNKKVKKNNLINTQKIITPKGLYISRNSELFDIRGRLIDKTKGTAFFK